MEKPTVLAKVSDLTDGKCIFIRSCFNPQTCMYGLKVSVFVCVCVCMVGGGGRCQKDILCYTEMSRSAKRIKLASFAFLQT